MSKHDSSGRTILATIWDAIQDVPELLQQISVLPDPGFNAWLSWDNSIDEIVMLESLAANVPYDNGSSGLAATDVQAAIDEIVVGTQPYAGWVRGSLGASVTIKVNGPATGWTVTQQATGRFRVTHNLGLAAATDLAVTPVVTLNAGGTDDRYCNSTNLDVNYFEVSCIDTGSGAVNEDFFFTAVILVPP